jgi:hypothetical protein
VSSTPRYFAKHYRGLGWSVICSHQGELMSGLPCEGSALDHIAELEAADAEALAAEIAECDALADFVNARGGYVAPDDYAGLGRGRAQDALLGFIEAHKAGLSDRSLTAAARDRGVALVALTAEAA